MTLRLLVAIFLFTYLGNTFASDYYLVDDCSEVQCFVGDRDCPPDSVYIPGEEVHGQCCRRPGICKCSPHHANVCEVPTCRLGQELVVKKKSSGNPGDCCDKYECQTSGGNCSDVRCPEDPVKCPADSYRLPSVVSADRCCSLPRGCACLPGPCPAVSCPAGTKVNITVNGSGQPGACCTQFECVKATTCFADGHLYVNGSTWRVDKCKTCTCVSGISVCEMKVCADVKNCGKMDIPDGECCPVCVGCISQDGSIHNNNDVWMADKCTSCSCIDGLVRCYAERCGPETSEITFAPGCPSLQNCDLHCVSGYESDEKNCFVCRCKHAEECNLNCEYGRVTDEEGNPLCRCKTRDLGLCPPVVNCRKGCGYKMDEYGCPVCTCDRCRNMKSCSKKCTYGNLVNDRGCPICKCRDEPEPTSSTSGPYGGHDSRGDQHINALTPSSRPWCRSSDGRLYDDGESWHDGCRPCFCHGDYEMCALITCPIPTCPHPTILNSQCCARCLGDALEPPATNVTVCHSVDGGYRVEGENWMLDGCTRCICHDGNVLCSTDACPPAPCPDPVRVPGNCCFQCSPNPDLLDGPGNCTLDDGTVKMSGESWRVSVCQSCSCRRGQIQCFSEQCPKLDCKIPILRKNQCCPMCIGAEDATTCNYEGVVYGTDEMWTIGECMVCTCKLGTALCMKQPCAAACRNSITIPGHCCPLCQDDADVKPTTTEYPYAGINIDYTDEGTSSTTDSDCEEGFHLRQHVDFIVAVSCSSVLIVVGIVLFVAWYMCRLQKKIHVKKEENVTFKPRPKSTNLDGSSVGSKIIYTPISTYPDKCNLSNSDYNHRKLQGYLSGENNV